MALTVTFLPKTVLISTLSEAELPEIIGLLQEKPAKKPRLLVFSPALFEHMGVSLDILVKRYRFFDYFRARYPFDLEKYL